MKKPLYKPSWPLVIVVGLFLYFIIYLAHCRQPKPTWSPVTKLVINQKKQEKKEAQQQVKKAESVRIVYRDRWHKLKDTIKVPAPCEPVVKILVASCDSALAKQDSSLVKLRKVIVLDSAIISYQDQHIKQDSLEKAQLNKEVKKERFWKRVWIGVSAVLAGVSVAR